MYLRKAGIDWFKTVFYEGCTFIFAALFACLTINPRPQKSQLYDISNWGEWLQRRIGMGPSKPIPIRLGVPRSLWIFWQLLKWSIAFAFLSYFNGLPGLGNLTVPMLMVLKGFGDWKLLPRIVTLPIFLPSGEELVSLIPTLEGQYRLLYAIALSILGMAALRLSIRLVGEFLLEQGNAWIRDIFIVLSLIVLGIILGSPFWPMDATMPYDFALTVILLAAFTTMATLFHFGVLGGNLSFGKRRRILLTGIALMVSAAFLCDAGIIAWYRVNWNNNWIQFEWMPLTKNKIEVTRWASDVDKIAEYPIQQAPTGNVERLLSLVRQWDQDAAYTKMKGQIGVNWMTLSDSDIIYYNGREYWVAPTTIYYPSDDWISRHLIYTHASRIIILDSHSGEFVSVKECFGLEHEPLIYYGEGFRENVYTGVKGFNEIENVTYKGEPDYVLSGWERALWFLSEGQLGFAFTPPQESIAMLYNRDILKRVEDILIYGLEVDPDAYPVSDGERLYYLVQVCINYPLHTEFSGSSYMRFFAVILVDMEDGRLQGFIVGKPDGFLLDFYRSYYGSWGEIPSWLIPQLRYPERLLGLPGRAGQLDVHFLYHVDDPTVWRSRSDFFERPLQTQVHYIVMMVGEEPHFVGIQLVEFEQSPGRNLAGLYIAYGGPLLGKIELYKVTGSASMQLIGPSAALQAVETDKFVQQQRSLLPNNRLGNILLYSIGGSLYYFIPVYILTRVAEAVTTKMAFIVAIDALTGTRVVAGNSAAEAYALLTGATPTTEVGKEGRLRRLKEAFTSKGIKIIEPTALRANVEILIANLTYVSEEQWNQVSLAIDEFILNYVEGGTLKEVYCWYSGSDMVYFGTMEAERGIVKLNYLSVKYG
jgi:uncharacterized membrane protein (UPF0182 family)